MIDGNLVLKEVELFCVLVNFGLGSKVLKAAKLNGVNGGTIFLGKGTVKNHFLEIFDITDVRKEIVLMAAEKHVAYETLEKLDEKFYFHKPNHGIAFSMSISELFGVRSCICEKTEEYEGDDKMHKAIFVIVDKGLAETVMDAATAAGSKGGTIINARGAGTHEYQKLFSMEIEPEKEIVMILAEIEHSQIIVDAIRQELKIDEPGNGVIFILCVNKTYGLG